MRKKLEEYEKLRTDTDGVYRTTHTEDHVRMPLYPLSEKQLYGLFLQSDMMQIITQTRQKTIFRRGFAVMKNEKESIDAKAKEIMEWAANINDNDQSLEDIGKQVERDLDAINNAYIIAIKKYFFNKKGEVVEEMTELKEVVRAHPLKIKIIADQTGHIGYNDKGEKLYFDPLDRATLISEGEAKAKKMKGPSGMVLFEACYRGFAKNRKKIFYSRDEVLHVTYDSGILYGSPIILSVWMKIVTLIEQDRYLLLAYQKQRPPRGILAMATTNIGSLQKAWTTLKAMTKKDPHAINPLMIESPDGKSGVQWIDLMRSLDEMQYTESRNEFRRSIGALYGVMPMFSGDIQTSGGLNNESQQLTITDDAAQESQKLYNTKLLPWILKQKPDFEGYQIKLKEPREKDENDELKKFGIRVDNAVKMQQMGFEVKYQEDEQDFEYSEEPVEKEGFVDITQEEENNDNINKILKEDLSELKKKEKLTFPLNKQSVDDTIKLLSAFIFNKVYDGQTKAVSKEINQILLNSIALKIPVSNVNTQITDLGVNPKQADLIIRTEQAILQNKVREINYETAEGSEDFKYYWAGPEDGRTSDVSKEIKRLSFKGMPKEKLKQLVKEQSIKFGFKPDRDWFSHPNQRHTFLRKF